MYLRLLRSRFHPLWKEYLHCLIDALTDMHRWTYFRLFQKESRDVIVFRDHDMV